MNRWVCEYEGCKHYAIGVSSCIGLRAIGWYFVPFGTDMSGKFQLFCPLHRPDIDESYDSLSIATQEAEEIQSTLFKKFNFKNPYFTKR